MRARLGAPKAITATAHKLARIAYAMLTQKVPYDESIFAEQERKHRMQMEKRLRNQAAAMGYSLVEVNTIE